MKKSNRSNVVTTEEREQFEHYLFQMDDVLGQFIADAKLRGFDLDYSISSLSALENFILAEGTLSTGDELLNQVARYLGEVFRKNVGGQWELCLKDPKYLFYKLPVVSGYSTAQIEFCPIQIVANFVARKESGSLKRAIDSHTEFSS